METMLLEKLFVAVGERKRADLGFKKQAWDHVLQGLHRAFPDTSIEQRQFRTKIDRLKEKDRELQGCYGASGFGRDPDTNMPTASSEVWSEYLAVCKNKQNVVEQDR